MPYFMSGKQISIQYALWFKLIKWIQWGFLDFRVYGAFRSQPPPASINDGPAGLSASMQDRQPLSTLSRSKLQRRVVQHERKDDIAGDRLLFSMLNFKLGAVGATGPWDCIGIKLNGHLCHFVGDVVQLDTGGPSLRKNTQQEARATRSTIYQLRSLLAFYYHPLFKFVSVPKQNQKLDNSPFLWTVFPCRKKKLKLVSYHYNCHIKRARKQRKSFRWFGDEFAKQGINVRVSGRDLPYPISSNLTN